MDGYLTDGCLLNRCLWDFLIQHFCRILAEIFFENLCQLIHWLLCTQLSTLHQALFVEYEEIRATAEMVENEAKMCKINYIRKLIEGLLSG